MVSFVTLIELPRNVNLTTTENVENTKAFGETKALESAHETLSIFTNR